MFICPAFADELVSREALECLEPLGEVVSRHQVGKVPGQLIVCVVVEAFDNSLLERPVHSLDLAIGPRVPRLGCAVIDVVSGAGIFEGGSEHREKTVDYLNTCLPEIPGHFVAPSKATSSASRDAFAIFCKRKLGQVITSENFPPADATNLIDCLRFHSASKPDALAYSFEKEDGTCVEITFGELWDQVQACAAGLESQIFECSRVVLLFPAGLDYIVAFLGTLAANLVAVPAYPPSGNRHAKRLQAIIEDARPDLILTDASTLSDDRFKALSATLSGVRLESLNSIKIPERKQRRVPGGLAFLQFTSGSTGVPKGVMVTHNNLISNEKMIAQLFGHGPGTRVVGWLPFYHDMGLIGNLLQPLYLGAPCFLMAPASFVRQPLRWLRMISKHRATTSGAPNFAYDLCVQAARAHKEDLGLDLGSWQVAFNGSEPVRQATMQRFAEAFDRYGFKSEAFLPCYGLAEATLIVTGGHHVAGGEGVCGQMADGLDVKIVDPATHEIRNHGDEGEIWVCGASVANGYWGREQASRETFQAKLASADSDQPYLRTGDLGRWSKRGLIVTGRIKDLIIVRGRNIHPQDIEAIAADCSPGLRSGGSAAFGLDDLSSDFVVVQEVERGFKGDHSLLLSKIRAAILDGMEIAPERIVLVRAHSVPKTTSGKVQRAGCRELYLKNELPILAQSGGVTVADMGSETHQAAESLEEIPAPYRLVARLAHIEASLVNGEQSLIALGLDSIGAARLQQEILERWEVRIPFELLLAEIPLSEVLRPILDRPESAARGETLAALQEDETWLASLGHEALWILQEKAAPVPFPEISRLFSLTGPLDIGHLRISWEDVVRRHPVLRAGIERREDRLHWHLPPSAAASFEFIDLTSAEEAERQATIGGCLKAPFDLKEPPLLRAYVLKQDDERHLLLLRAHHIILDLWSFRQILVEWKETYEALSSSHPLDESVALDFQSLAAGRTERDYLDSKQADRDRDYWLDVIGEPGSIEKLAPPLCAPDSVGPHTAARELLELGSDLSERLNSLARAHCLTLNSLLLTSWGLNYWKATSGSAINIGFPAFGRSSSTSRAVGYFVNPLPLAIEFKGSQSFLDAAAAHQAKIFSALEHQSYPAPMIAALAGNRRLFESAFIYQGTGAEEDALPAAFILGTSGGSLNFGGATLVSEAIDPQTTELDLSVYVTQSKDGLKLSFEYRRAAFDSFFVRGLIAQWLDILDGIVADPSASIDELLNRESIAAAPGVAISESAVVGCPIQALEAVVLKSPNSIAVRAGAATLSFAELDERANFFARSIRARGFQPETRIALLLDRSADLIAGMIGILKAGCAYLPLDTWAVPARLQWMIREAQAQLVIAEERFEALADETGVEWTSVQTLEQLPPVDQTPFGHLGTDLAAYLIFTSGSTGFPKGVVVERKGILNLAKSQIEAFQLDEQSQTLQFASPAFDASVSEIWTSLLSGGTLRLVESPDELLPISDFDFDQAESGLNQLLADGITTATLPPSVLQYLDPNRYPMLKTVIVAGERCPDALLGRWTASRRVINAYGPTEATVCATMLVHEPGHNEVENLSGSRIGFAIPGAQVFALTEGRRILPAGLVGELCISGIGLARGYFEQPALTNEKFITLGAAEGGCRAYRTGDLGRVLPNGEVEFFGRIDRQVKVRGVRIELEEVENIILNHFPSLKEAAVVLTEQTSSAKALVAFISDGSPRPAGMILADPRQFKSELAKWLPPQAIPSLFVQLDELPKMQNLKVDVRALNALKLDSLKPISSSRRPSRELEEQIAEIWRSVLEIEDIDTEANFFDYGGNSLNIATVHYRLNRDLGIKVPLVVLFEHSTVEALAEHCCQLLPSKAASTQPTCPSSEVRALSPQDRARARLSRRPNIRR